MQTNQFIIFILQFWYYILFVIILSIAVLTYLIIKPSKKTIVNTVNVDPVTGLMFSSVFFKKILKDTLLNAKPMEYELISFDIDYFKTINSYYNVEKGNEILLAIADSLREAYGGTSARFTRKSGDQFLVIKRREEGTPVREVCINYILPKIRKIMGEKYPISLSFGVYIINDNTEKLTEIINYADIARMQGKKTHMTSFVVFDENMKKEYETKVNITYRMEKALIDKEFVVVYQPRIDLKTFKISGAEALVRWKQKFGDTIMPNSFISVFENNGFVAELDMYVFEEVCRFISLYKRILYVPTISVNLSAVTVFDNSTILKIKQITEKYGIFPSEIEFEITESAIIANETIFWDRISRIKSLGFSIAIDDFGAGMSSLNRLCIMDVQTIKLDKAFFDIKSNNCKRAVVVSNIINMVKQLNMNIVAEGVETYEQVVWLKEHNCDCAQGYYFAKPMDKESLCKLLFSK